MESADSSWRPRLSPKTVRVGQELDFRIKVTGPAAWGMSGRPELVRYERAELGLRITAGHDQRVTSRQFERSFIASVQRERAIWSYRRSRSHHSTRRFARYVTHVTASVPVRVVAVPSFDPATIPDDSQSVAEESVQPDRRGRDCLRFPFCSRRT